MSRYQKGKTNLDFTEARDSEWQWHQLRRMQVCTSLQTDNHASTLPLKFLQAGCPSCRRPTTNSVKAVTRVMQYIQLYFTILYGSLTKNKAIEMFKLSGNSDSLVRLMALNKCFTYLLIVLVQINSPYGKRHLWEFSSDHVM